MRRPQLVPPLFVLVLCACGATVAAAGTGVHTTYLWHMHQPIYWPDASTWTPGRYETAYETITLGHSQNDEFEIFDKDDRVGDYQHYPRDAVASILDLPEAGAQVSFAGSLIENLVSLGDAGWNGGRYAPDWYAPYREARGWTNGAGRPRLEPVLVGFHHAIYPLMDEDAVRMELACQRVIEADAWGAGGASAGFFPAEMCFSERLIPLLVEAGAAWTLVADIHLARACRDYPYLANEDNCDPPNRADVLNPAQGLYTSEYIDRGVTVKVPYPFGFTPHRARHVDPETGAASEIVVVPASMAMGWRDGYGLYGTGDVDAIAPWNDPARPMLVVLAHDGDNAWSGGYSYYYENVTQFAHAAAAQGYTPTTVATYLQHHPVPAGDVVHVEDGGWVNADGDFGSPQFINWNWPLVNQAGAFDIPAGWAEDERNWAVLTAAQNRVETAAAIVGTVDPARVVDPLSGANAAERAWHHLLAGYESGYMYYGAALDMEIKATLACNAAAAAADPVIAGGADTVPPAVWLPQRLPWNPGGFGGGSLWGWPAGEGAPLGADFHVWTFAYDVSGIVRAELMVREDLDGANDPATDHNETYAGGADVGAWTAVPMNQRALPVGEPWPIGDIDFTVLPQHIADGYWVELTGHRDVLLDYYVEAEDAYGQVARTPIQHVYVGTNDPGGGFALDGELDAAATVLATGPGLTLWGAREGHLLYLATEGVGQTGGIDHFLLVAEGTGATRSAPWAKSGSCIAWDWFLGGEDSNNWCGWFDAGENLQAGLEFGCAQGTVLEGVLDLSVLYPGGAPTSLWLAAVGYETPDGGWLAAQAPTGDADLDVEADELVEIMSPAAGIAAGGPPAPAVALTAFPNPFNPTLTVQLALERPASLEVAVFDARGRRVATLHRGWIGVRERVLRWDGMDDRGRAVASGTYVVRAVGQQGVVHERVTLVR